MRMIETKTDSSTSSNFIAAKTGIGPHFTNYFSVSPNGLSPLVCEWPQLHGDTHHTVGHTVTSTAK